MSVKSPKRLPPEPELGSPRAVKLLQENPENEGELTEWLQSAHQEQCSIQQDVILSPKSTAADKARLELFQGQIAELDAQINLNRQRLKELRITAQLTPSEHILLKLISADAASMSEDQQLQLLEIKIKVAQEKHEITMVQLKEEHRTRAEELSELNEALDTVELFESSLEQLAALQLEYEKLNVQYEALKRERMLVVQILTEGGECSAEPFLELEEETWEPLIRLVSWCPELETRNADLTKKIEAIQLQMNDLRSGAVSAPKHS